MARRVESRHGETQTKLQGPTGSQIGHSSRNAGKPRTWPRPLGGGWGQRYKGSQRMRKLTTVKSVELVKGKFPVKFPLSAAPQLTVVTSTSARSGVAILVKDAHAASVVPSEAA